MGTLESILPDDITRQAITLGKELASPHTELVLPYDQTLQAIVIATEHNIAILGLDAFEVKKEGLLTVRMANASAYIRFTGDWKTYVTMMNTEAENWLRENRLGENHGYILSSASERVRTDRGFSLTARQEGLRLTLPPNLRTTSLNQTPLLLAEDDCKE